MNKDQVKGTVKDVKGRVERQVGEWTGNTDEQIKGAADQAEGKIQKGIGNVKEAGKKIVNDVKDSARKNDASLDEDVA